MTDFILMLTIQTIFMGVAIYFWIKSLVQCVTASNWTSRILNFFVALLFFFALLIIGFYWWDTIETNNTFFSKPIPKVIELP